ncbi:MAG: hypothetical protein U0736_11590 [Gemmataceae bacterium]
MAEAISYPDQLPIEPLARPPVATVVPPGSKSISNRALVLAALSSVHRPNVLHGCLRSEDTEVMIAALDRLGYAVTADWDAPQPTVTVQPRRSAAGAGDQRRPVRRQLRYDDAVSHRPGRAGPR